jgi:hypothetical protein
VTPVRLAAGLAFACLAASIPLAPSARGAERNSARPSAPRAADLAANSDILFQGPESALARQKDHELIKIAIERFPDSYELLWRGGRAAWAIGDRLDDEADSDRLEELGLEALAWTKRAVELRPDGIEGHFWHGLAISVYSRGISIVKALFKGLGGEFEDDMNFVIGRDPAWGGGGAQRALGRYYYRLPRIKRDLPRSEALLRESLRYEPKRLRTHLFLADTLAASDRPSEAAREYEFVLSRAPGPNDLNEVDTLRARAREGLQTVRTP